MDIQQMRERCPQSELSTFVAEARDWVLCFPRKSSKRKGGVGSIARKKGSSVWGVVFSVSGSDLSRLDGFEGVPNSYRRKKVQVVDGKEAAHKVWTYIAIPQAKSAEFTPHPEYLALYIKGAKHFGLPRPYIESLIAQYQKSEGSFSSATRNANSRI
jgi:gamma-glutamylcyclotransferase